jgi:hypothetical protein
VSGGFSASSATLQPPCISAMLCDEDTKSMTYTACPCREVYDEGHKERLEMFTSERRPNLGSKVHCSAVHPAGCTVCQTCHFCR